MTSGGPAAATALARPVDLSTAWNATNDDAAARLHPLYRQALERLPEGEVVLRGLPFRLGRPAAGKRWILVGRDLTLDLGDRGRDRGEPFSGQDGAEPGSSPGRASHLVVAHFCDSWRDPAGERPAGLPVGWVMPAGEPLARYELGYPDGRSQALEIRRRFEIDDGIIGWGFLPYAALSHHADETLDWRGPFPRQEPGRYARAGHAGPLTMLPGTWAAAQTGAADFVPTADGRRDPLAPRDPDRGGRGADRAPAPPARRRTERNGRDRGRPDVLPRPGRSPRRAAPAAALRDRPAGRAPEHRPGPGDPVAAGGSRSTRRAAESGPLGWGRPVIDGAPASVVDVSAAPDARLRIGAVAVDLADVEPYAPGAAEPADPAGDKPGYPAIGRSLDPGAAPAERSGRPFGSAPGTEPTPARVRFVAGDGRYLPPLGHRDEINPGIFEDTGAGLILGRDTFAYVEGEFQVDLPVGPVEVEIVKGFEHRPIRQRLVIEPAGRDLSFELEPVLDLRRDGWQTSDSHVHFLAPSTALLQAAAEDLTFVHLLATQLADYFINVSDLAFGSQRDPTGRHAVIVGTENRQNLLGHLALLGANPPVLPLASGAAPEGRIGQAVSELLADWAIACRAAGGLVVGAHFPLPYAEIAADIVAGLIDAVEIQCFAPGLDNPSILEWYRYLNCGQRVPLVGGTDKMSAEVPVGQVRTYARVGRDAEPTFEAWSAAVRAGRTFVTSGPVLELTVEGTEPGGVIRLPAGGGRLEVVAEARAVQPRDQRSRDRRQRAGRRPGNGRRCGDQPAPGDERRGRGRIVDCRSLAERATRSVRPSLRAWPPTPRRSTSRSPTGRCSWPRTPGRSCRSSTGLPAGSS